jgi:hypothetical protein
MRHSLSDIGRVISRCTVLSLCSLASCARSEGIGPARNLFTASTSEGTVLVRVEGLATGFTNSELTRLIRSGLTRIYPIQCDAPSDISMSVPRMVWHVINDGRRPTAMVTVRIIENGRIVRSGFTTVSAPGANPDAVFMREFSDLAYGVMPPAAVLDHFRSTATRCRE